MNDLLLNVIGMPNAAMRQKVIAAGLDTLDACSLLVDSTYVHSACQTVRKSNTGAAASKEVTMLMEQRLIQLCDYARWQYVTNGDMAPAACTLQHCTIVHAWKVQLQEDPDAADVALFDDKINKKIWFESVDGYLSIKKGYSGYPVLYVVRAVDAPLVGALAPQWGQPTMDEHLKSQGRHNGHFYGSDNATVWHLLWRKCHGTNAWNCIGTFQATRDGRGAYRALHGQYLGRDVQALLLRNAEATLESLRFDGKDKNLPWDQFVGIFREALHDLGEENQMTEQRKVHGQAYVLFPSAGTIAL